MATNSITASTVSPFNSLLFQDAGFNVTASFGAINTTASTPSINFKNVNPWPVSSQAIVNLSATNTTTSSGSVNIGLQESADNSTWNNIAIFAFPLLTSTGSVSTTSTQVILGPNAKQYLRAIAVPTAGTAPSGSVAVNMLF